MPKTLTRSPEKSRRPSVAILAAGLVIAVAIAAFAIIGPSLKAAPRKSPATLQPAMTVTVQQVRQVELDSYVEASGPVTAWQEAIIGARINGLPLKKIFIEVGDPVHKGQLLALFDDASVRAELAQAVATLAQARAAARQADVNRERSATLKDSGAISDEDILQHATQAETTNAQVAVAQASLDSARLKLDYTRVLAPDDGVVSARSATLGGIALAGTELFRLIRRSRLEWRAELNTAQVALVTPELAVHLTLPDGSLATGRVRQLAPALDSTTRLGVAYVDIDPGSPARASMYATGRIQTGRRDGISVPGEAVVIRDGRSYVFLLGPDDRVQQVAITTGRYHGRDVEVSSGLTAGSKVVLRGAGFLNDHDLVRVVERREPLIPATAVPEAAASAAHSS